MSAATAAASKPSAFTPKTPAATSSVGQFKPVNSVQATSAAGSTKAPDPATLFSKTTAATSKPITPNPSASTPVAPKAAPAAPAGGYSSKEGDRKPRAPGLELWSYQYEDAYDLVLEYLLNNGHVDTLDEALYVMMEMDVETIGTIVEGGFNSSGRYDVGGGRTVGPVAGAIRSLVTGNLPKQKTYIPPSPRQGTNTSPAVPPSKDDSGKSTDFGAGGGKAKMKTGMTVGQVERQGRMNKGDYSG